MDTQHMLLPGLKGKTAIVTGAGGAIGGAIARALARAGTRVSIWDISGEAAKQRAVAIKDSGGHAIAVTCDVTDRLSVSAALESTLDSLGEATILINGAGGSSKQATTADDLPFFDILPDALARTFALNYSGTVIPCQLVGAHFAKQRQGNILNIASIGGLRPLSRAIGYSNAKAAIVSFTEWLAIHMAREYTPAIRVNALAPGFVLTDQNRFLLIDEQTGKPTARGHSIMDQVPMGRYGRPEEMTGAALWLVSDAATYVTGTVVPVDGGLLASLGV